MTLNYVYLAIAIAAGIHVEMWMNLGVKYVLNRILVKRLMAEQGKILAQANQLLREAQLAQFPSEGKNLVN